MRRAALAVLLFSCSGAFAAPAPADFSFSVTSDMRSSVRGEDRFEGALKALKAAGPGDFMLTPGDEDPAAAVGSAIESVLGKGYPWYPVVGNHDKGSSDMAWLRELNRGGRRLPGAVRTGPPGCEETTYSFDHGTAHFAVLNEYCDGSRDDAGSGRVGDALYRWLKEDLEANRKPVVFVVGHVPMLVGPDADADGPLRHQGDVLDSDPKGLRRFHSLLKEHGVRAYICGHTHAFSTMKINGVWQLDAGHTRGAVAEGEVPSTFIVVHVRGGRASADVYRADARGRDYALKHKVPLE